MAKRRSRKRRRSLGARLILIIALTLMIAGFLTRRMLMPTGFRTPHHADPSRFGTANDSPPAAAAPSSSQSAAGERLDAADRAELNRIIRSKTR